jgi:hypothetical protein
MDRGAMKADLDKTVHDLEAYRAIRRELWRKLNRVEKSIKWLEERKAMLEGLPGKLAAAEAIVKEV